MAFKKVRGKTKTLWFKGDTAREVRDGSAVSITDSGTIVPLRNDSTDRVVGVARRNDTVTDSAQVPVEVPIENWVEYRVETDSDAGAADSDVGRYVGVDTAGGGSVNAGDSAATRVDISDTAQRLFLITAVESASIVHGVFVKSAAGSVRQLQSDTVDAQVT